MPLTSLGTVSVVVPSSLMQKSRQCRLADSLQQKPDWPARSEAITVSRFPSFLSPGPCGLPDILYYSGGSSAVSNKTV